MNWEIGIDMYTVMCIKWMTNKNLLYKKINKIKLKKIKGIHVGKLETKLSLFACENNNKKLVFIKMSLHLEINWSDYLFLQEFSNMYDCQEIIASHK